ncbi:MAG TPA: protein kinase [Actinomycetota bacterium]|nr:protein kinase [Actinomycetota bacterium]
MASDRRDAAGAAPATSIADRYVLEGLLARGGMGSVYRARDEVLARTVAVKILHPHLSEDAAFLERFRREAVAAAGLGHPGIVAIYDTGTDSADDGTERHYIVMEHCAGGTLTELMERERAFDPARASEIVAAVCSSLDFAHRAGVVHRDVKPDNVLFSDDGTLKVADFGIAKAAYASGDLTTTGSILGTVTYISPEQAAGREPDARSDVYSAGVVLYELLTGRPPFTGETDVATAMMHLKEAPTPVRALKPHVPRHLDGTVAKALAKEPDDRWASAADFERALAAGSGATAVMSRPRVEEPAPEPAVEHSGGEMRWVGPVVGLILFALLLAFLVPRLLEDDPSGAAPRGNDRREAPAGGAGGVIEITGVESFDPDGDGQEHSEEAPLAADGDPSTSWGAEDYQASLADLGKGGIGLVLDLGSPQDVSALELQTSTPGFSFEIRAAEAAPATAEDAERVTAVDAAGAIEEVTFDEVRAQYWLVWITKLPGEGGGTVEIQEVMLRGAS